MASESIEPSAAGPSETSFKRIADHQGNDVLIICPPGLKSTHKGDAGFAPFLIQIYILDSVAADAKDVEANDIPKKVGSLIERVISTQQRPVECHLQLYLKPQRSILTCLPHTKFETVHRNRHGIWPLMVPQPPARPLIEQTFPEFHRFNHHSFFLVIDRCDLEKSFTLVGFVWEDWWSGGRGNKLLDAKQFNDIPEALEQNAQSSSRDIEWRKHSSRANHGLWAQLRSTNFDHMSGYLRKCYKSDSSPGLLPATLDHFKSILRLAEKIPMSSMNEPVNTFMYTDCGGINVTSVWAQRYGSDRPKLSVRLYLAEDCPFWPAEEYYNIITQLDRCETPWTLDISEGRWALEEAHGHNTQDSYKRRPTSHRRREPTMAMILAKTLPQEMPQELLDQIMSYFAVPPVPDWSPYAPKFEPRFQDVFLFLNAAYVTQLPHQRPLAYSVTSQNLRLPLTGAEGQSAMMITVLDKYGSIQRQIQELVRGATRDPAVLSSILE